MYNLTLTRVVFEQTKNIKKLENTTNLTLTRVVFEQEKEQEIMGLEKI